MEDFLAMSSNWGKWINLETPWPNSLPSTSF